MLPPNPVIDVSTRNLFCFHWINAAGDGIFSWKTITETDYSVDYCGQTVATGDVLRPEAECRYQRANSVSSP